MKKGYLDLWNFEIILHFFPTLHTFFYLASSLFRINFFLSINAFMSYHLIYMARCI